MDHFLKTAGSVLKPGLWIFLSGSLFAQGSILMIGGGDDRKSWADAPFAWFVEKADSGVIINIDVDETAPSYATTFISFGADPLSHDLRIRSRAEANDSSVYADLATANGIFIEGGDQWDYVSTWKGTLFEEAIHEVFKRGGVIAGTSAGLAVLGGVVFDARNGTLHPEDAAMNPYHPDVSMTDDFLEILPGVLTDSHFHQRGRLGRLVPMLARRIQDHGDTDLTAVGVDVNTAFCLEPDRTGKVYGEGAVTVLHRTPCSRIMCESGKSVTFTHIHYDQLIYGAVYDLGNRTLLDPGPGLVSAGGAGTARTFADTVLDGSQEPVSGLGSRVVTGLTRGEDEAWYGRLGIQQGQGILAGSVIIPRLWSDPDYFENRWVGGMYGAVQEPGAYAVYLDDVSRLAVTSSGLLSCQGLCYLLDTEPVTHTGFHPARNTNYPGIVNAVLHFLGDGDTLNLPVSQAGFHSPDRTSRAGSFTLHSSYPNPFNGQTSIPYEIPRPGEVRISIFDSLGREIESIGPLKKNPGTHVFRWEAGDYPSGFYVVQVEFMGQRRIRRMVHLK